MDRAYKRGSFSENGDYSNTEVYTSEDELMANPSGNRTPKGPDLFVQSLQDAQSHSPNGLGQISAQFGRSSQESRTSGSTRGQVPTDPHHPSFGTRAKWPCRLLVIVQLLQHLPLQMQTLELQAKWPCRDSAKCPMDKLPKWSMREVQQLQIQEETHCTYNKYFNRFSKIQILESLRT